MSYPTITTNLISSIKEQIVSLEARNQNASYLYHQLGTLENMGWLASATGIPYVQDTLIEFTHGLGREPVNFLVGARVATADNGYSIDDFIPLNFSHGTCSIRVNATVVTFIARNNPAIININNPAGTAILPVTNGTLEFYVK